MKDFLKASGIVLGVSFGAWGLFGSGYSTEYISEQVVIPYFTETKYDNSLREGVTNIEQEGVDGSKTVLYEVTKRFDKETERKVSSETIDVAPINEIVIVGTKKYYTCSNGVEFETLEAKNECEKKIDWEAARDKALAECRADGSRFDCWYDAYPGTTLHWSYYTYTPAPGSGGIRYGAICRDGTRSNATGRGACSHHGGVSQWLTY